ncbi:MAG: hypothetical protein KDE27_04815 [Planctomycetes bacterium]|nr:hypothetical protein [Planctomycetota bacterium]
MTNSAASSSPYRSGVLALALVATTTATIAQDVVPCQPIWLPGQGIPGVNGNISRMTTWDPDGAGPAPAVLVCAGTFARAGRVAAMHVAAYDPVLAEWSGFGSGIAETVTALQGMPNGDLIAGGIFGTAGGVAANNIARWDGTSWSALGAGVGFNVTALTVLQTGDLVAAGWQTGGIREIAVWDGNSWSTLATMNGIVDALAVQANGDLIASGSFTAIGGAGVAAVARWDGASWSALGAGFTGSGNRVSALRTLQNGDLVVGGSFSAAGGVTARNVARWDGNAWSAMGATTSFIYDLVELPNGDVAAAGDLLGVAQWDGVSWQSIGTGLAGRTFSLAMLPNGSLAAGGDLQLAGGYGVNAIALWDGSSWSPTNPGTDAIVYALTPLPNGDLLAGGSFRSIGGAGASRIALRRSGVWQALGQGMNESVRAVAMLPNGDIVAGGIFSRADGASARYIARWDGTSWTEFGAGTDGAVAALEVLPNGDLLVAGAFTHAGGVLARGIARWDGSNWQPLGTGVNGAVMCLAVRPDGHIVVGGLFGSAGGVAADNIAEWDGSNWSPLGSGVAGAGSFFGTPGVSSLALRPNGDLVVGGHFAIAGGVPSLGVAEWVGRSRWRPLDCPMAYVAAVAVLPDGDVLAAGNSTISLQRWNGLSWGPPVGSVTTSETDSYVTCIATMPDGEIVIGGLFTSVGGRPSSHLAHIATTCPATFESISSPYNGTAGPLTLSNRSLPWIGGQHRSVAAGFAANALGALVVGLDPVITPLSALHPAGVPGCDLVIRPLHSVLLVPTAVGTVELSVALPDDPGLIGIELLQQVLQVEFGTTSTVTSLSGSNGVRATLGDF